jgi:hypothetical protein
MFASAAEGTASAIAAAGAVSGKDAQERVPPSTNVGTNAKPNQNRDEPGRLEDATCHSCRYYLEYTPILLFHSI